MMRLSSIYEMCGLQPTWFEVSFDSAAALLLMIRDWAHDVFLQTERIGSIGHMIGEFLAVVPTEAVPTPAGLRSLCCLTRASTATAGFGWSSLTRFLTLERGPRLCDPPSVACLSRCAAPGPRGRLGLHLGRHLRTQCLRVALGLRAPSTSWSAASALCLLPQSHVCRRPRSVSPLQPARPHELPRLALPRHAPFGAASGREGA